MSDKEREKQKKNKRMAISLGIVSLLTSQFAGHMAPVFAQTLPLSHEALSQKAEQTSIAPKDILLGSQQINAIFPDARLAAAVANRLQKAPTDFVTQADLNNITTLQPAAGAPIEGINSLEGIQFLTRMTTLGITNGNLSDTNSLAPLEALATSSLTSLNLGSARITDITSLAKLTQLRNLSLVTNRIVNIEAIGALKELRSLNLTSNRIVDLSPLQNLPSDVLTDLTLSENTGLGAGGTVNAALSHFTALTRLTLANAGISSLAPIADMNSLTYLSVGRNKIDDAGLQSGNLSAKSNLTTLYLRNNMITESGLAELSGLSNLASLYLSNNLISDPQIGATAPYALAPLTSLANLKTLEINNNMLRSLAPLQTLSGLVDLSATGQTWRKVETNRGQAPNETVGIYNKNNVAPSGPEQLNIVQGAGSIVFDTPPLRVLWQTLGDNTLEWTMPSGLGSGVFSGLAVYPTLGELGEPNPELGPINMLFPDAGLAQAVADTLGLDVAHVLTQSEADSIETLDASSRNISRLNGLKLLRHLVTLDLTDNDLDTGSLTFFANVPTGSLQDLGTILLNQNHLNDLRAFYHFRGGNISGLTLSALDQRIYLADVRHRETTPFSIYNLQEIHDRTSLVLDQIAEGSHIADQLLWDYIGENQIANWTAQNIENVASGQFSGQVIQTVTPNEFDIPINQIFSDLKVQEAIAAALTEGRNRPAPIAPVAVTDYTSAAELALLGLEAAGNKYPRHLTLDGVALLDGSNVLGGGAHYVGLATLPNLQELTLTNATVTDFSTLMHLPNMTDLTINATAGIAKAMEIFDHPNFNSVKHLTLNQNDITDVSHLGRLSGLNTLTLNHNQIANLGTLSPLLGLASGLTSIVAEDQSLIRPAVLTFTDSPMNVFNIDEKAVDASKWSMIQGQGTLRTQASPSQTFVSYSQVLADNKLRWEESEIFTRNSRVELSFSGTVTQASLPQVDPTRPTIDNLTGNSSQGYVVTGTGAAGEVILIRDPEGNIIATTTVQADGTWRADIPSGKVRPGQMISAVSKNADGKISEAVQTKIPEDSETEKTGPQEESPVETKEEQNLPDLGEIAFPVLALGGTSLLAAVVLWLKQRKSQMK
ncbi:leucine-rich repeat domain-containing protein [Lactococcus ileimucosae]|uniref:leucine-rich repeat domain-containing protein n=1 Tax=Lactococcus ileimucosae TaxID=2941329 RepID=UPI003517E62F